MFHHFFFRCISKAFRSIQITKELNSIFRGVRYGQSEGKWNVTSCYYSLFRSEAQIWPYYVFQLYWSNGWSALCWFFSQYFFENYFNCSEWFACFSPLSMQWMLFCWHFPRNASQYIFVAQKFSSFIACTLLNGIFPSSSTSVTPHKIQWRKKMACRLNGKRMKLRSWSDLECDANADEYNGRMARCISLVDQAATRTSGMLNATRIWKNQLKWM